MPPPGEYDLAALSSALVGTQKNFLPAKRPARGHLDCIALRRAGTQRLFPERANSSLKSPAEARYLRSPRLEIKSAQSCGNRILLFFRSENIVARGWVSALAHITVAASPVIFRAFLPRLKAEIYLASWPVRRSSNISPSSAKSTPLSCFSLDMVSA